MLNILEWGIENMSTFINKVHASLKWNYQCIISILYTEESKKCKSSFMFLHMFLISK